MVPLTFSVLARSRLPALVVAMLISGVRPFRSSFPNSAFSSRTLRQSTQALSASRAGQFELSDYVKSNFLQTSDDNISTTRIKTVNPTFISLSTALEEYSGDEWIWAMPRPCVYELQCREMLHCYVLRNVLCIKPCCYREQKLRDSCGPFRADLGGPQFCFWKLSFLVKGMFFFHFG